MLSEKLNPLPGVPVAGEMSNRSGLPSPDDRDGENWARTTAFILAPPLELYALWRDVQKAPLWQKEITRVTVTSPTTWHWAMESNGETIEWDSELLADEPGKRIAWRSTARDSATVSEVLFESAPAGRGTLVTVLRKFRVGKLASLWETLVGRDPRQEVRENLQHLKALAETGEVPRTQEQPQGIIGKLKESLCGETLATSSDLRQAG